MKKRYLFLLVALQVQCGLLTGQTIVTTKHNLSVSGPGTIKASSEQEICIFCHTPHNSNPQAPLWNRSNPGVTYTLYSSSTLQAIPGQPDGSSVLCLSCHDGTIALGNVASREPITFSGGTTVMPTGNSNLSTDLSNDHPISFTFDAGLATNDGQLKSPSALTAPVTLQNGKVQCVSCHDPHSDQNTDFLVTSSKLSALCLSCHNRNYWTTSTHQSSSKTWNNISPNPWFHTPYTTVADNACENCHNPHNAGGSKRLMKYGLEENNCLDCHNTNVAAKNIQAEFAKTYRHDIGLYNNVHEINENTLVSNKHVECEDCHNPHAVNASTATAPFIKGSETGVSGIDQNGNAVSTASKSYEICYKCHSSNTWAPARATTRMITERNIRLQFDPSAISYHPVAAAGKNATVPSLISPYTTNSIIYCTSCHASDGTNAPAGPHGSNYPQILKKQYLKQDGGSAGTGTPYSPQAYELCFSCHNSTFLMNPDNTTNTFKYHDVHVRITRAPCNTCHDPHGIATGSGTDINNARLINFKSSVVTPSQSGKGPIYEFISPGHGRCYLTCHGQDHDPKTY